MSVDLKERYVVDETGNRVAVLIGILRRDQKELAQLPKQEYERVKEAIANLSPDP